mmetsp:Transcript_494/g.1401  ORF Transcript_494/g.1401 Transcript_494/m.1401 type:complete len:102 (+) Transcript_494:597-902(+)
METIVAARSTARQDRAILRGRRRALLQRARTAVGSPTDDGTQTESHTISASAFAGATLSAIPRLFRPVCAAPIVRTVWSAIDPSGTIASGRGRVITRNGMA